MHATERVGSRDGHVELSGRALVADGAGRSTLRAATSATTARSLVEGAGPVRLAAEPVLGYALPAPTQALMLRAAHAPLAPTWPYRRFMGRILRSLGYRAQASNKPTRSAIRWKTVPAPATFPR